MTGLLAEMIGNISTVRSFGGEPAVKQRYDDTQAEWKVTRQKLLEIEWRSTLALNIVNAFCIFTGVAVTVYGALQGKFTAGDILFILTLTQNLVNTLNPIARQINQMSEVDSTAERLVELLEVESDLTMQLTQLSWVNWNRLSLKMSASPIPARLSKHSKMFLSS
ncbi:MAG: ABC transporter transmembrane domain-containing protein [Nitrosomonadales bacterium]